jgi:hypothetical protein
MPQTPSEAIGVLRRAFGAFNPQFASAPETDPDQAYGDPGGSLALHALQSDRAGELADQIDQADAASLIPREGYVQGEPGRRTRSNRSALATSLLQRRRLGRLSADMAADPFTGEREQARVRGVQDALDEAATTQRPELTDAANAVASRNAFATYMKSKGLKMGEYEAAASPAALEAAKVPLYAQTSDVGQRAAADALERKGQEKLQPTLVPGQMPTTPGGAEDVGGGFSAPPNMKPPGATLERQMADMQSVAPLITSLERELDPTSNEVSDKVANYLNWSLYKAGMQPRFGDKSQERYQLASLISIAGATPYMRGTRAYQYLKEIQKHLTDPTASDAFLSKNIRELKEQWPKMYQGLLRAHYNPGAPLTFDNNEADMTDPNRGR